MPKRKPKKIQVGNKQLVWGKQLLEMIDSTDLYETQEFPTLRRRLETEGYLFVRGVVNEATIQASRHGMLHQAAQDGAVLHSDDVSCDDARIGKHGRSYAPSYCLDGITGTETNERENIDVDAWMNLGPSRVMRNVYDGSDIQRFWANLFGPDTMKPLVKQTFLRLMGRNCGTIEHADYYYFKKDTDVFSDQDGRDAVAAASQYLKQNDLWDPSVFGDEKDVDENENDIFVESDDCFVCGICLRHFERQRMDPVKLKRLEKGDFGVTGDWHCPSCASKPMAIYTTWISLSIARPSNSILSICPKSHRLTNWDMPKQGGQVPSDFNWKLPWVIPSQINLGDVIIFNVKTVHAASKNTSRPPRFRVSFDTRIQLVPREKDKESTRSSTVLVTPYKSNRSRRRQPSPHPGLAYLEDGNGESDDATTSLCARFVDVSGFGPFSVES